jgi:hypothetical protein
MVGYCAIVAVGISEHWSWPQWWFDLWTPVVDFFRHVIPVFDHFERVLAAKGSVDRLAPTEHLLAFGWVVNPPVFVFLTFEVLTLPADDWARFVRVWGDWCVMGLIVGTIFFLSTLSWTVFGFMLSRIGLVGIGIFFYGATLFGICALISLGGLIVRLRRSKHADR